MCRCLTRQVYNTLTGYRLIGHEMSEKSVTILSLINFFGNLMHFILALKNI